MNKRFVAKRILQVFSIVFVVLSLAYVLRGQAVAGALEDAALWAFLSSVIFAGTLIRNLKQKKACPICIEPPPSQRS